MPIQYYHDKITEDNEIWNLPHTISQKLRQQDSFLQQRSRHIWCCADPSDSVRASQHKRKPRVVLEIDCTGLTIENSGDFHLRGIDYYLIIASEIAWNRTRQVLAIEPTQRRKTP